MLFEDYARFDGLGLAELIRSGETSAAEVRETALAAISRFNPALNAVLATLAEESARSLASGLPVPFTPLFNATGQPAISLPLHWTVGGLPMGVQLVGRFGAEATLLSLAGQLERAQPWAHRLPVRLA